MFDTTLRDGAQTEGVSFSVSDKLEIVKTLDEFGVRYIEAGNPGSNPKDMEFFKSAAGLRLRNAQLVAFGSTKRTKISACDDSNVLSLLEANTDTVAIFGKSWDLHVTEILNATLEENLNCVRETVSFLKSKGKEVIFDAEHFFDGIRHNAAYAVQVLQAARDGGADVLVLCDTNGGTLPMRVYEIVRFVCEKFPGMRIGIHCHNDSGCAVANSMMAVEAGGVHVQGTFMGIGERCGNADLSVIIPNLQLKGGYQCIAGNLETLSMTEIKIAEIANLAVPNNKPYVGGSAFAHKGGMHIDGVDKLACSFEHIDPALVGNRRKFLLSEVSGKKAVLLKVKDIAPELTKNSPETALILERLKELEHEGYQFEAADASFELMVKKVIGRFRPHFELSMYKASSEHPAPDGEMNSNAMIKSRWTAAPKRQRPLATARSTRWTARCAAHSPSFTRAGKCPPDRLQSPRAGNRPSHGSRVRVLIESTDGHRKWITVGVSTDIIEASFKALVDSLEYKLCMEDATAGVK
jgi:2-isopropylmalate synthase